MLNYDPSTAINICGTIINAGEVNSLSSKPTKVYLNILKKNKN